jgi:hypothetical protein
LLIERKTNYQSNVGQPIPVNSLDFYLKDQFFISAEGIGSFALPTQKNTKCKPPRSVTLCKETHASSQSSLNNDIKTKEIVEKLVGVESIIKRFILSNWVCFSLNSHISAWNGISLGYCSI